MGCNIAHRQYNFPSLKIMYVNGTSDFNLKKLGTNLLLGDDMHINVKNSSESRYLKPATIRNVTRITRQGKDVFKKCLKS